MNDYLTVREASSPTEFDRSQAWLRAAAKCGKIKFTKAGRLFLIEKSEKAKVLAGEVTLSRKEMAA